MIPRLFTAESVSEPVSESSKTFYLNPETNRIEGKIDGMQAVEQSIVMMLSTERYSSLIYDWNYGSSLEKYLGKPYDYIVGDAGREIRETLLTDDRITDVHSFSFHRSGDECSISFTVETIFGSTAISAAISI